jgi:hypothetical protein
MFVSPNPSHSTKVARIGCDADKQADDSSIRRPLLRCRHQQQFPIGFAELLYHLLHLPQANQGKPGPFVLGTTPQATCMIRSENEKTLEKR